MKTVFSIILLAASVSAHGVVTKLTVGAKSFKGNLPGAKSVGSPIRLVTSGDPIKGATNPDVNCGRKAAKASEVVNAMPGDKVLVKWNGEDGVANWPHNTGPMLTYLASCGSSTCDKFDSTTAKWFKIDQVGRKTTGDKAWVQADLMTGSPASVTLPSNLASGNYLLRHEIIALHLAETEGGAEFYPSCSQLTVGGNETGKPEDDELVSLPGAYKDTDPGILFKGAFDPTAKYTFPGPKVAKFVSSPSNDNSTSTAIQSSATSTKPATSTTSAKGAAKTCNKKKSTATSSGSSSSSTVTASVQPANAAAATVQPSSVISLVAATASASSSTPSSSSESSYNYAKRSMPRRVSRVMKGLGFQSYGRM